MSAPDITPLAKAYQAAQSVVCFIHPQATYDAVAAATGVALALSKLGKSVTAACESPMRPEYSRLFGLDVVHNEVGNRDLVISFPYQEETVDKVNYNLDEANQRFELVISPKAGYQALEPQAVEFRKSGMSADMVLLFGFHAFNELGRYYEAEKYTIESAYTVAITQGKIPAFAKYHVSLQPDQLSYSEWLFLVLRQLGVEVKDQAATNFLSGIDYATEQLQTVLNPRTFESVVQLMRQGAQRLPDNPAYQYLATPIRDPQGSMASSPRAISNAGMPPSGQAGLSMNGMPMNSMPMGGASQNVSGLNMYSGAGMSAMPSAGVAPVMTMPDNTAAAMPAGNSNVLSGQWSGANMAPVMPMDMAQPSDAAIQTAAHAVSPDEFAQAMGQQRV